MDCVLPVRLCRMCSPNSNSNASVSSPSCAPRCMPTVRKRPTQLKRDDHKKIRIPPGPVNTKDDVRVRPIQAIFNDPRDIAHHIQALSRKCQNPLRGQERRTSRHNLPVSVLDGVPVSRMCAPVPCPATPRAPVGGAGPALVAQRCGSLRINPRTRLRAGSGRAPPAYLLTTSTTCLMVCTISRRTSVSLRMCSSDMGGRRVVERLSEGMGWRLAVKSRRIRICASIWAVAY